MATDSTARIGPKTSEARRLNAAKPALSAGYVFWLAVAGATFVALVAASIWVSGLLAR